MFENTWIKKKSLIQDGAEVHYLHLLHFFRKLHLSRDGIKSRMGLSTPLMCPVYSSVQRSENYSGLLVITLNRVNSSTTQS